MQSRQELDAAASVPTREGGTHVSPASRLTPGSRVSVDALAASGPKEPKPSVINVHEDAAHAEAAAAHEAAMAKPTPKEGKYCERITFEKKASFYLCTPPGALKSKFFMSAGVEHDIGTAFHSIVEENGGWVERPWVIDVGMNEGFFTLLPASLGARVVSFELQPDCLPGVRNALALSELREVTLKNVGIAPSKGEIKMHSSKWTPSLCHKSVFWPHDALSGVLDGWTRKICARWRWRRS